MVRHIRPEERDWRRLLRDLDTHPAEGWRIFGLLGEPDQYPNSLYKLYVHRGGSARWWMADSGVGRISHDPIARQASLPKDRVLSADRLVEGDATVLRGLTCDPQKVGLVKLLGELQRRLSA